MNGDNALMLAMAYTDAQMEACGNVTIDDDSHTTGKTYSSEKIKELVDGKAAVVANQTLSENESALEELTIDGVKYRIDNVPTYDTMPSTESLLTKSNGFIFRTRGFYSKTDGHGGYYKISTDQYWALGSLKLSNSKWLCALDSEHGKASNYIDVCRYGVREYPASSDVQMQNMTAEECYGDINSDVISRLHLPNYRTYLQFPQGRFFFESPIVLTGRHLGIRGENMPQATSGDTYTSGYFTTGGTTLYFPFLQNGEAGITVNFGNIENISIYGNIYTYNMSIDRSKTVSAPDQVVTEFVKEVNGSAVKCIGIKKTSSGFIRNVRIMRFYTGLSVNTTNAYIENVYAFRCHFGVTVGNDIKLRGIYGWYCHTLLKIDGSITSAIQLRVDSCVHTVQIANGNGVTVMDIDGDYCTDSLIVIGDLKADGTSKYNTVSGATIIGAHGRCCALKSYDSTDETSPDVRTLADTSGYGVIKVLKGNQFNNSFVVLNAGPSNPFDGKEGEPTTYRTPSIILTRGNSCYTLRNQIVVNSGTIQTAEDILKNFQVNSDLGTVRTTGRFDLASGTYTLRGNVITKDMSTAELKTVVADSSDFADFKTKVAAL